MDRNQAHIYFAPQDEQLARSLWEKMKQRFDRSEFRLGPLEPGLRGPHLMSQFEMDFPESCSLEVLDWLKCHRGSLSVLIHPELEDEIKSHLNEAIWLGIPLPLNFSKLDLRSHGRDFVPFGDKPKELQ